MEEADVQKVEKAGLRGRERSQKKKAQLSINLYFFLWRRRSERLEST